MLQQRILSGLLLVPIVLGATYAGGWIFFVLVLMVTLIAGHEFFTLMTRRGDRPAHWLALLIMAGLLVATMFANPELNRLVLVGGVVLSVLWQIGTPAAQRSITNWAVTLAGILYIGWLASFILSVRSLPNGFSWTVAVLVGTWFNDSAAYLTGAFLAGRFLGRHPFAPTISPKKTWEGAVAGWLACTLIFAPAATYLGLPLPISVLLGLVVGFLGTMGDLGVSVIKRQVGAKDSGHLIPGHGGMLDRVDSLLFVSAIVYYFVIWFG